MRIGSSSRQDHWVERSQSAQPGPGKYTDQSTGIGRGENKLSQYCYTQYELYGTGYMGHFLELVEI